MTLDLSKSVTAPPPKTGTTTTRTNRPSSVKSERESNVNGLFAMGAAGLLMWRQTEDAYAVSEHGEAIAHQIAELAETSPQIAKVIDYISSMGPWAALLTACMPLTLQILVNHDRIPAHAVSQFGIVPKEALQAKAATEMALIQAQAQKESQEAQEKLRLIQGGDNSA